MREGHNDKQAPKDNVGITPAYAGRTVLIFVFQAQQWDHPRLCGKDEKESVNNN